MPISIEKRTSGMQTRCHLLAIVIDSHLHLSEHSCTTGPLVWRNVLCAKDNGQPCASVTYFSWCLFVWRTRSHQGTNAQLTTQLSSLLPPLQRSLFLLRLVPSCAVTVLPGPKQCTLVPILRCCSQWLHSLHSRRYWCHRDALIKPTRQQQYNAWLGRGVTLVFAIRSFVNRRYKKPPID